MKNSVLLISFYIFLSSCSPNSAGEKDDVLDVNEIVQKAIDSSGTNQFQTKKVSFQFRDIIYKSIPTCNGLKLQRFINKDSVLIKDEFYKEKLNRTINDSTVVLNDSIAHLYAESVNSVHYFVQLPYRLQDEAVQKKLIGKEQIDENEFYKIKVTFQEDGGGDDFEDVYYYWIEVDSFRIAYLAYSFKVNGGGIRFRKAIKRQKYNQIEFVDYENYKPKIKTLKVQNAFQDYFQEKYSLVSVIENTNIQVEEVELHCKD